MKDRHLVKSSLVGQRLLFTDLILIKGNFFKMWGTGIFVMPHSENWNAIEDLFATLGLINDTYAALISSFSSSISSTYFPL